MILTYFLSLNFYLVIEVLFLISFLIYSPLLFFKEIKPIQRNNEPLRQINSRCSQGFRLSITVLHTYSFNLISSKISYRQGHIQRIFSRHLTKVRPGHIRYILSRHLNDVQDPNKLGIYILHVKL